MLRKPAVFFSTLALATLGLAACGDDSEGTVEDVAPTATTEETPETQPEPTVTEEEPTAEEPAQEDGAEEKDAPADNGSVGSDPGPAPEGTVIPAEAVANPPESIDQFTLMDDSGPAYIYSDEIAATLISIDSNILSSPYESLVEYIEIDNTPAGTGSCGLTANEASVTCYLHAGDGVVTITAAPEEISLDKMVVFANKYAELAGAA